MTGAPLYLERLDVHSTRTGFLLTCKWLNLEYYWPTYCDILACFKPWENILNLPSGDTIFHELSSKKSILRKEIRMGIKIQCRVNIILFKTFEPKHPGKKMCSGHFCWKRIVRPWPLRSIWGSQRRPWKAKHENIVSK